MRNGVLLNGGNGKRNGNGKRKQKDITKLHTALSFGSYFPFSTKKKASPLFRSLRYNIFSFWLFYLHRYALYSIAHVNQKKPRGMNLK